MKVLKPYIFYINPVPVRTIRIKIYARYSLSLKIISSRVPFIVRDFALLHIL